MVNKFCSFLFGVIFHSSFSIGSFLLMNLIYFLNILISVSPSLSLQPWLRLTFQLALINAFKSCLGISASVVYVTYPSSSWKHQPRYDNSNPSKVVW